MIFFDFINQKWYNYIDIKFWAMKNKIIQYLPYLIYTPIYIFILYVFFHIYNNIEDLRFQYTLYFWLWVLFQTIFILPTFNLKDYLKLLWCFWSSLFWLVPWKNEDEYDLFFHILAVYVMFIILYVVSFAEKIIQAISEITVYVLTLSMWYIVIFKLYNPYSLWNGAVIWMPIFVLSIISFLVAKSIYLEENSEKEELALYISFILMLVFLSLLKISFWNLDVFFTPNYAINKSFLDIFITWSIFSYSIWYIAYIIQMIPFHFSKYDTQKDIEQRVKKFKWILTKNFTNDQLSIKFAWVVFVVMAIFFALDYYFLKLPNTLVVDISFILVVLLQFFNYLLTRNNSLFYKILNKLRLN